VIRALFSSLGNRGGKGDADLAEESVGRYDGTLIARNLTKAYKSRRVVDGVSLGVRRGEAVGLLGPNGAGKTTCFYMITGLVPVDSGTIEIDGHDVSDLPMYRRARLGVGYLPQEASIFRGLSVEANIRAVLEVVEKDRAGARGKTRQPARGIPHFASAQVRLHLAFRRRAAASGNRPCAGVRSNLHAA
jgi:lipopolysaccharide export system ATP-binding protein